MKAKDLITREDEIAGWPVRITSFRLGERYYAAVESADPGARIARGDGESRASAETTALEKARDRLGRTRRFPTTPATSATPTTPAGPNGPGAPAGPGA